MTAMTSNLEEAEILELNELEDYKLCFVDLEANDVPIREIIQFGAIKKTAELNLYFKPQYKVSRYITKLTHLDDQFLQDKLDMQNQWKIMAKFISGKIIITFGNFDYWLLQKTFANLQYQFDNRYFDLQKYIYKKTKINISLEDLAKILNIKYEPHMLHNGFYDAWILQQIYFQIKDLSDKRLLKLIYLAKTMDSIVYSPFKTIKHFKTYKNTIRSFAKTLRIDELVVGKIKISNKIVKYIKQLKFLYVDLNNNFIHHYNFDFNDLKSELDYSLYNAKLSNFFDILLQFIYKNGQIIIRDQQININFLLKEIFRLKDLALTLNYISVTRLKKLQKILHLDHMSLWEIYPYLQNHRDEK